MARLLRSQPGKPLIGNFNYLATATTPVWVQSISATGSTSATSIHFSANPIAGNAILVAVAVNNATSNRVSSVTDSASNTYTRAISQLGTGQDVEIWYALNITSGGATHTVTATAVSGDAITFDAQEVSGISSSSALDVKTGSSGTGTALSSGATTTPNKPTEFVFVAGSQTATRPYTVGAGYSNLDQNTGNSLISVAAESKVISSAVAQTGAMSIDTSQNWACVVATFAQTPISTTTTSTKTQTGKARITATTTKTQTGVTRITASTTRTQTGVARILVTTTKTQTGVARIALITLKTQTGKARITASTTRTQTGVANIAAAGVTTTTKTQTGKARISGTSTKTQSGVSRITVTTTKAQTGLARITGITLKTQTGVSRIGLITTKTQTGVTRITASTARNQSGVANITTPGTTTTTKTQTGKARITATTSRTQSGISRITSTTTRTQAGVARIGLTSIKNQAGVARITLITARTQTGISRITGTTGKTQTGTSRISATTLKTQTGVARIVLLSSRTQTGVARIAGATTKNQTGVANIINANAPSYRKNASLMLDTGDMLIGLTPFKYPVWNTTGRPAITGVCGYNTDLNQIEIYTGTVWKKLLAGT